VAKQLAPNFLSYNSPDRQTAIPYPLIVPLLQLMVESLKDAGSNKINEVHEKKHIQIGLMPKYTWSNTPLQQKI
jgi:hypothetical protein